MKKRFEKEANLVFGGMSENMANLLMDTRAIIAGGIVSRVFSGRDLEGADIDVYFRTPEDLANALYGIESTPDIIFDYTDKSVMIKSDDTVVQFIIINTFKNAEELFESFDFTCVMGAYDCLIDDFIFHPDFLVHNSQRRIVYNPKTSFPIISALRVSKYQKEGYTISRNEYVKILLSIMNLSINSWQDAEKQFGKFYGFSLSGIIGDEVKNGEFSTEKLLQCVSEIEIPENKMEKNVYITDFPEFVEKITHLKRPLYKWGTRYLTINKWSTWCVENKTDNEIREYNGKIIDLNPYKNKVYKYVDLKEGKLFSQYRKTFEYIVGEIVSDYGYGLWFYYLTGLEEAKTNYGKNPSRVMIECEPIEMKTEADFPSNNVILRSARVIRIVPNEEVDKMIEGNIFYKNIISHDDIPF